MRFAKVRDLVCNQLTNICLFFRTPRKKAACSHAACVRLRVVHTGFRNVNFMLQAACKCCIMRVWFLVGEWGVKVRSVRVQTTCRSLFVFVVCMRRAKALRVLVRKRFVTVRALLACPRTV